MNVTAVVDIVVIPCERRFIVVILWNIAGAAQHADIIAVVIVVVIGMES